MTIQQVKEIYEISNSETCVIISIFAGRAGDTGKDPVPTMTEAVNICKTKKNIEILRASTSRSDLNIFQANHLEEQLPTINFKLKKTSLIGKSTEESMISGVDNGYTNGGFNNSKNTLR